MKTRCSFLLLGIAAFCLAAGGAVADVVQVQGSGELAAALVAHQAGDTIELAAGSYAWPNQRRLERAVHLKGATGDAAAVVIDLAYLDAGLLDAAALGDVAVTFEDLTLRSYEAPDALLEFEGMLVLEGCVVADCVGPALIRSGGSVLISGTRMRDNTADWLVEVAQGDLQVVASEFSGNAAGVANLQSCAGEFSDVQITGNSAGASGISVIGTAGFEMLLLVENSSIQGNDFVAGGIDLRLLAQATISESVILDNGMRDGTLQLGDSCTFACCDIDLDRWLVLSGAPQFDDSNCSVGSDDVSLDQFKAMYR